MGRILIAMVIGGVALLFVGVQELRLTGIARPQAQTITCDALGKSGPGDNAHVVMTDFLLSPAGFVYEGGQEASEYKTVWIPALPLEGEYQRQLAGLVDEAGQLPDTLPPPRDIRIIIKSSHLRSDDDIRNLPNTIQGVVVNKVSKISGQELSLLRDSYPGIDFSTVWILDHNRMPASTAKTAALVGGGAALILIPAGVSLVMRLRKSTVVGPTTANTPRDV